MEEFPPPFYRPLRPNGLRRASWHDYHSRSIYLLTLSKRSDIPVFSYLRGASGNPADPPRVELSSIGKAVNDCIFALRNVFPVSITKRMIMPDHIHIVLFVKEKTEAHLGDIVRHLKKEAGAACDLPFLFEEGYHDRILMKKGQLQRMIDYVLDNPRRRILRLENPSFFCRRAITVGGNSFECYGNNYLLADPDIEAVRISRKFTEDELRACKKRWQRTVENDGVLVSPFISRNEKKVFEWAINNGGNIILICDNGFEPRFSPKGILHTACGEGRLLLIAQCEHSFSRKVLTRASCCAMNALAETIANCDCRF